MLVAKDFRQKAREALNGHWGVAVGTGLVASLLGASTALGGSGGGSGSSTASSSESEEYQSMGEAFSDFASQNAGLVVGISIFVLLIVLLALILVLIHVVIGGAVTLGYVRFNLNLVDGNNPRFADLFSQFNRLGQGFLMQLLRGIYIFLWTLLLIIPGIIATYRYAMTPYILHDNPDMSAADAITESKKLMDGNKWRLFCLNFSFIGWDILCLFTLGIGYLWLAPYREAAYAAFYKEIQYGKYSNPVADYTTYNFSEMNADTQY